MRIIKNVTNTVSSTLSVLDESTGFASDFVTGHRQAYSNNASVRKLEHLNKGLARIAEASDDLNEINITDDIKNAVLQDVTKQHLEAWGIDTKSIASLNP